MQEIKFVRINPLCGRKVQVVFGCTFQQEKGWYRVPDLALAAELAKVRMTENPLSAQVFEVCSESEANAIMASERKRSDPAGTVAAPKELQPVSLSMSSPSVQQPSQQANGDLDRAINEMSAMERRFNKAFKGAEDKMNELSDELDTQKRLAAEAASKAEAAAKVLADKDAELELLREALANAEKSAAAAASEIKEPPVYESKDQGDKPADDKPSKPAKPAK
jgi:hypothetical protein